MEFRLIYQGRLKGNGSVQDKHIIRAKLDPQLRKLWTHYPLKSYRDIWLPGCNNEHASPVIFPLQSSLCPMCVCLVSSKAYFVAEVNITLLRPDSPGNLVHSGDIDNRLKTLLDALRMPKNCNEIYRGASACDSMYCVLEDDNLISSLSVSTDRLLLEVEDPLEVVAIIRVAVKITRDSFANMGLAIAM